MIHSKARPFRGATSLPEHVEKWIDEVGMKEGESISSGQWRVERAYDDGPVYVWLLVAETETEQD